MKCDFNFTRRCAPILLLLVFCSADSFGQKMKEQLAERYAQELDFPRAALIYEDIAESGKATATTYRNLAVSYNSMGDMAKAEETYSRLINQGINEPKDLLQYGDILRTNGKYLEAVRWYKEYDKVIPNDIRATQYIDNPDVFLELAGDSASVIHGLSINSKEADLGLTVMDELLVFSSSRGDGVGGKRQYDWDKQPYLNLYTALYDGLEVKEPLVMRKEINSRYHDGTVSFDSIAQRLYFTRNNVHYGVMTKAEDGELKLGIYYTDIREGPFGKEWSPLVAFEHNNTEFNYGHPCVGNEGRVLFFVSDMAGGFGGTDLYMCDNLSGSWGVPQNLGPSINTPGNEMYPFFGEDSVLYFASDGHPGLGGLDLFLAPSSNGRFGNAYNLNYPVNTRYNDHGLILTHGNVGFIVSDRPGGQGSDDIYGLKLAKPLIRIKGITRDQLTTMPVKGATVMLKDRNGDDIDRYQIETNADGSFDILAEYSSEYKIMAMREGYFKKEMRLVTAEVNLDSVILNLSKYDYGAEGIITQGETELPMDGATIKLYDENDNLIMETISDENGKYMFPLEPEKDYRLRVEKDGFFNQSSRLSTKGKNSGVLYTDFKLYELELDKVVRLDNIYYDVAKWNIRPDAGKELDKLIQTLWDNPTVRLELSAHTDCRGSDPYNLSLSKKRAKSAVEYMIKNGVPTDRIISKGYGETDPVEDCACTACSDQQHQNNRRTQFKVLDF